MATDVEVATRVVGGRIGDARDIHGTRVFILQLNPPDGPTFAMSLDVAMQMGLAIVKEARNISNEEMARVPEAPFS